eukprot:308448-Prymnesium_polylepis.1
MAAAGARNRAPLSVHPGPHPNPHPTSTPDPQPHPRVWLRQASAKLSELQADDEQRRSSQSITELLEAAAADYAAIDAAIDDASAAGECAANGVGGERAVTAGVAGVKVGAGAAHHADADSWHESLVATAAVDVRASVAASSLTDDEWHETLEPEADGDSGRR